MFIFYVLKSFDCLNKLSKINCLGRCTKVFHMQYKMISVTDCSVQLLVKNLQFEDGKMIPAAQYFRSGSSATLELTEEEKSFAEQMRVGCALVLKQIMI